MNLQKFFFYALLSLIVYLGVSFAEDTQKSSVESTFPMTVEDDMGTAVTISSKPQRIVSLTMFSDDVLLELVDKDRLVAITTFAGDKDISNIADRVADFPSKITLNVEIVLSLNPDIVIVANWSDADQVKQLKKVGVNVFLMESGLTVDTIIAKIRTLAKVVGEVEKGERIVEDMKRRLTNISSSLKPLSKNQRLSIIDYTVWGTAQGTGTSWDEVVTRAGLINVVGNLPVNDWGQVPLSKEKLIEFDPDIIILPGWVFGDPAGADNFYNQTVNDPALKGMKAIVNENVYKMPESLKTTTSHYIVDAIEILAALAYPHLFE